MKRKFLPLTYMFAAGAVTAVVSFLKGFTLLEFLWALVATFVVFYIVGCMVRKVMDKFDDEIQEAQALEDDDDGAVIEKTSDDEEDFEF